MWCVNLKHNNFRLHLGIVCNGALHLFKISCSLYDYIKITMTASFYAQFNRVNVSVYNVRAILK